MIEHRLTEDAVCRHCATRLRRAGKVNHDEVRPVARGSVDKVGSSTLIWQAIVSSRPMHFMVCRECHGKTSVDKILRKLKKIETPCPHCKGTGKVSAS